MQRTAWGNGVCPYENDRTSEIQGRALWALLRQDASGRLLQECADRPLGSVSDARRRQPEGRGAPTL